MGSVWADDRVANPAQPGRRAGRQALALAPHTDEALEAMSVPAARPFLVAMAAHLSTWLLGVGLIAWAQGMPLVQALLGVLLGSTLHALTVLQHDCGHQSAFRSKTANLWVGRMLAWFILLPFTSFTELHRLHHSHLGVAGRDPDNWFYAAGRRWMHLRECFFLPRFIWLSLRWPLSSRAKRRVLLELAANLVVYGVVVGTLAFLHRLDVALFAVLLPMLALACIFNPLARGAEHAPLSGIGADDPRREDLRFNTVTVASRFWGLAWANITYHVEHHLYPRVPFHRLPALHARLCSDKYLHTTRLLPFMRPPQAAAQWRTASNDPPET
jgi:beta-carotene hydroxylase